MYIPRCRRASVPSAGGVLRPWAAGGPGPGSPGGLLLILNTTSTTTTTTTNNNNNNYYYYYDNVNSINNIEPPPTAVTSAAEVGLPLGLYTRNSTRIPAYYIRSGGIALNLIFVGTCIECKYAILYCINLQNIAKYMFKKHRKVVNHADLIQASRLWGLPSATTRSSRET